MGINETASFIQSRHCGKLAAGTTIPIIPEGNNAVVSIYREFKEVKAWQCVHFLNIKTGVTVRYTHGCKA